MSKKKILVVDDEISFTRLLKLNLEQTNSYEVQVENWPEDAVSSAQAFQPDLVLLDVLMPRMFGGEVAAKFQEDDGLKETPIVFLTAAVSKSRVREHSGTISGYPFLAKPVSVEEVVAQIEKGLNQPRMTDWEPMLKERSSPLDGDPIPETSVCRWDRCG